MAAVRALSLGSKLIMHTANDVMSSFHVPVKSIPEVTGSPRLTGAGAAAGSGAAASAACRRAAWRAEPRVARLISLFRLLRRVARLWA